MAGIYTRQCEMPFETESPYHLRAHGPATQKRTLYSTKPEGKDEAESPELEEDPLPAITDGNPTNDFVFAIEELPSGKIYTNQAGFFPIVSSRGIKSVIILYDYDSNAILVEGITSKGGAELLRAYTRLKNAGAKPRIQRLDNEASMTMKIFLHDQQINF